MDHHTGGSVGFAAPWAGHRSWTAVGVSVFRRRSERPPADGAGGPAPPARTLTNFIVLDLIYKQLAFTSWCPFASEGG